MKKIFTKLVVVLIIPALYLIFISAFSKNDKVMNTNSINSISSFDSTKFVNMIQNMDYNKCDNVWVGDHLDKYKDSLGYNAVHVYPSNNDTFGSFDIPYSFTQIKNNNDLIDSIYNKNLKFFYEQIKFSFLCYAQRLTYMMPTSDGNTTTNNGFCYSKIYGELISGDTTILHVPIQALSRDTCVCENIFENLQQSDKSGRQNDDTTWYIKPMVKLDTTNWYPNTPVFRIEYFNFNGDLVDSQIIYAKNFKNPQGTYDGNYTDNYYTDYGNRIEFKVSGNKTNGLNQGRADDLSNLLSCKVDFKIYTYGQANFWIKKVTVDDWYANKLFDPSDNFDDKINDELSHIGNNPNLYSYYMDEVTYSQLPCIKYVMDRVNAVGGKFMVSENNWMAVKKMRNKTFGHKLTLGWLNPRILNVFAYELWGGNNNETYVPAFALNYIDPRLPDDWKTQNYNTYNNYLQTTILGSSTASGGHEQGTYIYQVCLAKQNIVETLSNTMLYITPQMQGEMFIDKNGKLISVREPLNEEIEAQTMCALAHGAQGLIGYVFQTVVDTTNTQGMSHVFGLYGKPNEVNNNGDYRRTKNLYGQNKWGFMKKMNAKINKWIPTLDKIKWDAGYSVHSEGATHYFISNIQSLYATTNSGAPLCEEDNIWADCNDEKYWEEAFFTPNNTSDNSKYFLMTNRRCSPDIAGINLGDLRQLKVYFMASQLTGFNNWKIINVENDSLIATYNKSNPTYVDFGIFQPGEGKLFKITPAFQIGGTLAGDETINGNVNCNGMIYNGGHNITFSPNAVVTFSDSAGIEMNGGCFVSGVNADNADAVTLTGKSSNTFWKGITLIGCDSIGVYNTNISNIKANDTAKAFSIINSYKVNFRRNTINANSNSGGIQAVYNSFSDNPIVFNVRECNFNMNQSGYSAISILSNASVTLPIVAEWCLFNSQNDTSNAILFNEVTGGAIKNNVFTNFGKSVVLMYSATDFYGNTILGKNNSQGILCLSGSYASLSQTSGQYLGGYNCIKNYGSSACNVYSNNSYFNIQNGQNDFDLNDIDNSKHLTGTISGQPQLSVNALKNCFHKDSITNIDATHSVIWDGSTDPVNFVFTEYSCELSPPGDYFVYQYGGYSDTVYYRSGGEGSGYNPNKPMNIEENVYKSLKDSININLRKRNYLTVEDKAKQLLTLFPDSLESSAMVQKLYMASLSLDSTKIGITKSFLENLIAANTQNPTLIKRAFYFIQKCKVKLGQYQSALDGFQYIMTQNPYTYEGLVASWDYAATYLLMGAGGSYKGDLEQTTEELNTPADTLLSRMTKSDINTNKSKNSNRNSTEQITKTFYEKIKSVTKDDKTTQEAKVKTLEKKIETTKNKNEKSDAITELATMKQIKEVVKLKKPNTIVTHTAIINNDIRKVFGIGKGNKDESKNNLIPQTYTLYQNYPNPFNPTTKIAYDIPRDAKVKLVIYDILGREMKTLVNNEFRSAGKYITEFNGSNLASGIYFARILVNEGKDFMAVKKLVLLK